MPCTCTYLFYIAPYNHYYTASATLSQHHYHLLPNNTLIVILLSTLLIHTKPALCGFKEASWQAIMETDVWYSRQSICWDAHQYLHIPWQFFVWLVSGKLINLIVHWNHIWIFKYSRLKALIVDIKISICLHVGCHF